MLDSELAGSLTAAGALTLGQRGGHPEQPASGTPTPPLFLQRRPKVAAAAAWSRGGLPPTPTCCLTRLARRVALHHGVHPSHRPPGQGQACLATGLLGLAIRAGPSFPPLRLTGRERQAPAGASLGARGTRIAAGPAPGPTNRRLLAPIRRLGQAGRVLMAPGEPVQPPTPRAGRQPSKGHVSPTFSTRSGHYPPTVY